jgi:hypothetical protein
MVEPKDKSGNFSNLVIQEQNGTKHMFTVRYFNSITTSRTTTESISDVQMRYGINSFDEPWEDEDGGGSSGGGSTCGEYVETLQDCTHPEHQEDHLYASCTHPEVVLVWEDADCVDNGSGNSGDTGNDSSNGGSGGTSPSDDSNNNDSTDVVTSPVNPDDADFNIISECVTDSSGLSQLTAGQRAEIADFIEKNGCSDGNALFIEESINFLSVNSQFSFVQYENWFHNNVEGIDFSYDNDYWDNPNLTFQQQSLPSWNDYYNAYPKNADGTWMTGADNVFNFVGGDVLQARLDYPNSTNNPCALKVSIALNGAGINIPAINSTSNNPGTLKGADGKYYFLNAKALNSWMKRTFGTNPATSTTPLNVNHFQFGSNDGGANGINFPTLLSSKKGIYTMLPFNSSDFGASGHCDIFDGNTCAAGCYFGSAQEVNIWVLN